MGPTSLGSRPHFVLLLGPCRVWSKALVAGATRVILLKDSTNTVPESVDGNPLSNSKDECF